MKINDFELEVFFGKYEFSAPYLLSQSDCESMEIGELLDLEEGRREEFLKQSLSYTEVTGSEALRKEISHLYKTITPDEVIVHAGAQEPIFNLFNVLLEETDHVICQFPAYQSLYEVARSIGCQVDMWRINGGDHGFTMSFDELKLLIKPNTKVICINNPNNPTGFILSNKEMEELVRIAKANDIYLICDEVYKGLEFDSEQREWFADIYDKAISIGVMSKAYGLAGLRIGWTCSKDQEVNDKLIKMKHYTTICNSGPSEYLATIALKHGDKILERNKNIIKENMIIADGFFAKHKELFIVNQPKAGPIAFHKLNIKEPIEEFILKMIEEAGVLLLGGYVYQIDEPYFRMGYGRKNFKENLQKFDDYLEKLNL